MKPLRATYRVQLRPEFTFTDAAQLAEYLAALGISHLYTSPSGKAVKGSSHGYDVVDPGRVNDELGGATGHAALCDALQRVGLGQLVDIVPNHMAIQGGDNAWWWDVLENGPSSRYASFFDVEWRAPDFERVLLPVLGDHYGVELEAKKIKLVRDGERFMVAYYEHLHPVAPRSLGELLAPVAQLFGSEELGFLCDALRELPSPQARDASSRRRRHRDKRVLQRRLWELCADARTATAIDEHLARISDSPDALHEVLEHQNYRLAYWRIGKHELEYRRFFDIDSLVGLRVEDEETFEATHQLVLGWLERGRVDGVRIDHIDGLYDPKQYLVRLRRRAPAAWILVEKILEPGEPLQDWPVAGTTGYDFLNAAQRLFVDPEGEAPLSALYEDLIGTSEDFADVVVECKRVVLRGALGSDVRRLVSRLHDICQQHRRHGDYSHAELEQAIVESCVAFGVYRSYTPSSGQLSEHDRVVISNACRKARESNPELDARLLEFLERLLLLEWQGEAELDFVLRLQQLTGPVMAKGVEDTAFYRYQRLVALNEVGGDPALFALAPDDFHRLMRERQARMPATLNTTSTHDTKRSEDVRARLLVLSEIPARWALAARSWCARPDALGGAATPGDSEPLPDVRMRYGLLQNLVGAWPIARDRLQQYALKAAREAKLHTSWHAPDATYEAALERWIDALYDDEALCREVAQFAASLTDAGYRNSLCQLLLKLTCPGVPDVYQGTDSWDFSLVDPDNRRPVDYDLRRRLLSELDRTTPEVAWEQRQSGAIKLHVLRQTLRLRARHPACFDASGDYTAFAAEGSHANRVIAFGRGDRVLVVATRFWQRYGDEFGDTKLGLPPGEWSNVLAEAQRHQGEIQLTALLGSLPLAALERVS